MIKKKKNKIMKEKKMKWNDLPNYNLSPQLRFLIDTIYRYDSLTSFLL